MHWPHASDVEFRAGELLLSLTYRLADGARARLALWRAG
jgi:hypothetical protein